MIPYVPESAVALDGRQLPQALQEKGCEIRCSETAVHHHEHRSQPSLLHRSREGRRLLRVLAQPRMHGTDNILLHPRTDFHKMAL